MVYSPRVCASRGEDLGHSADMDSMAADNEAPPENNNANPLHMFSGISRMEYKLCADCMFSVEFTEDCCYLRNLLFE